MPSKYQEYRQMADTAERQLTSSYKSWTQFLRTAARLYKYPYNEQVMIHAQRPDATACAEYDFWNKKMGRFVRRGSTGIALIDTSGQKPQLRYVFDVADTGEREHSRPMHLWQFRAEHEDAVAAALERSYGVSGKDGIVEQMESAAAKLAREYWADYKRDILHNIDVQHRGAVPKCRKSQHYLHADEPVRTGAGSLSGTGRFHARVRLQHPGCGCGAGHGGQRDQPAGTQTDRSCHPKL